MKLILFNCLCVAVTLFLPVYSDFYISNLTTQCMRCLCKAASNCNTTVSCIGNYCGSFQLSHAYWRDAISDEQTEEDSTYNAFLRCAQSYTCSQNIVENYIIKFGKDCNNDGVTNCDDYAMLHFNLKEDCSRSIQGTNFGSRYDACRRVGTPV